MNQWHCDKCGKATKLNPRTKPIMVQDGVRKEFVLDKDGKPKVVMGKNQIPEIETREVPNMVQKKKKMYQQSTMDGAIKQVEVGDSEFIDEPAIIIKLKVGHEHFICDLCKDCLATFIGPEVKALRSKIISLRTEDNH